MAAAPDGKVWTGIASWYGDDFQGKETASGEPYDKEAMTAAHRSLAFGTLLLVRSLDNGASVVVRVNDRGPFVEGRILDLSEAAARILGVTANGTGRVTFSVIGPEEAAAFGAPLRNVAVGAKPATPAKLCRIQVGSFRDERNAQATLQRLKFSGIAAAIEKAGPYNRVVISSIPADQAEACAQRLRDLGYIDLLITWYQ